MLQYLLDANYLDATNTRQLSAEMMTYNAELQVVGYTRATFDWKADGAIQGAWREFKAAGCGASAWRVADRWC